MTRIEKTMERERAVTALAGGRLCRECGDPMEICRGVSLFFETLWRLDAAERRAEVHAALQDLTPDLGIRRTDSLRHVQCWAVRADGYRAP